jgi:hypothetical protein
VTGTRRRLALVALAVVLAAATPRARAQPPDGDTVFQTLASRARAVRGVGAGELVTLIESHLGVLDTARRASLGGRISPEYRESLLADAALLDRARGTLDRGDRERGLAAIRDVEADLALKRRHVEAATGFSGAALRTVNVKARTMRGAREEPGHVVWYVPRGWSDVPERYARFDGLSSPTEHPIAPGNYLMWAGAKLDQRRQPITVGGQGRSQQTVDLPLP